jgi:Glyoxalase-like domain
MALIGNHLKMTLPRRLRERARRFYGEVLGCPTLEGPSPNLDLYQFAGGTVVGLFFVGDDEVLPEEAYLKATWLEIKVMDPEELRAKLLAFGVRVVDDPDKSRFFFQAPGGQVFRLAPLDGGI